MKWEHKVGIALTCTFLCLVGAVIGLKMREQASPQSSEVAEGIPIPGGNLGSLPGEPLPAGPAGSTGENASRRTPSSNNDLLQGFNGNEPPPFVKAKEDGKNATQIIKNEVPAPSAGMKGIVNAAKNAKNDKALPPKQNGGTRDTALLSAPPPRPVEPTPTLPRVKGADEWYTSVGASKDKNQSATPALPADSPKTTSSSLPPFPAKNQSPSKPSAPSGIVPTSSTEPVLTPPEPTKKLTAPSPTATVPPPLAPPGTGSSPTPSVPGSTANTAAPLSMMPAYLSQQPTNAPKTPDVKAKDKAPAPATSISAPAKMPDLPITAAPQTSTPPQAPAPASMSAITPPLAATPAPPPASTSPPPLRPTPSPVGISAPTSIPAPVSSVTPPVPQPTSAPTPPKPPADGSSFVPDTPTSANGPVGVRPAPLPLPVPPSSPLTGTPDRLAPTPVPPASSAPSVIAYDEQDYSCRPGDTWAAISKHFYMTDLYAKALQRHNQNHARASDRMRDTGQVAPGERIFVPQSYVLEQRYGDAIVKPAATSAPTTMPVVYPSSPPTTAPPPAPPPNR